MARRFSFSSPDRRGADDPWFRVGSVDVTTTLLVAGLAAVSFLVYAVDKTLLEKLVLVPSDVRSGQAWRLVTWPLVNKPDIWSVITLAVFWWFGRDVEGSMGRSRFLWFLLMLIVGGGLVATAFDDALGGFVFVEIATFVAFAAEHAHARFFFNIPAWVIAAVFVGLDVLQRLGDRQLGLLVVELFMVGLSLLLARSYGLAADAPWIPKIWLPGAPRGKRTPRQARAGRGRLAAVPTGPTGPGLTPAMQAEMDELLDKISAGGLNSLSSAERKRLDALSKRVRGN